MVNETKKYRKKALCVAVILGLVAIIGLVVAFLGARNSRRSCNPVEYKAFDDRVFYYPDSEMDESILSTLSNSLVMNYPDPNVKVLIINTPVLPDGVTVVRGYQMVDGAILENTFFAIDIEASGDLNEFPLLMNPGRIKLNGLMAEDEVEDIAYAAIEAEAKRDNVDTKGSCSYELFFTNDGNGVIDRPASGFYYEYIFNLSNNEKTIFPRGFVYIDGETGEILESFIDSGIRT